MPYWFALIDINLVHASDLIFEGLWTYLGWEHLHNKIDGGGGGHCDGGGNDGDGGDDDRDNEEHPPRWHRWSGVTTSPLFLSTAHL